jgi:hypothetical protein
VKLYADDLSERARTMLDNADGVALPLSDQPKEN